MAAVACEKTERDWSWLALLVLVGLGVLSGLVYWRWLVQPYLLAQYVAEPLLDLGKIGGYDPAAGWRYSVPLIVVWLCYGAGVVAAVRVRSQWALLALAGAGALALALVLVWLYPITAADIFNYVLYGLAQHRGKNPLVMSPRAVFSDNLLEYSAWPDHPSPYGPIWQGIAWLVTAVTGERLLAGIVGFKLVLVGAHLLNVGLIALLAQRAGGLRPGVAALVYGWNPLLLYETAGNGHNDIVMLTAVLLALVALTGQRVQPLALPLVTLGALAKYVAALWAPMLFLGWLVEWRSWRRLWVVALSCLGCLALTVLAYAPYWEGGQTLEGVRRQADLYTTSFGGLAMIYWAEGARMRHPERLLDLLKQGALIVVGLTMVIGLPRSRTVTGLVRALFDLSLVYLLVGALWFQPWYLVPLVGLLPLVNAGRRLIGIAYALGATGSYVVYFYLWPALQWTPDRLVIQRWAVGVAHGPALVATLAVVLWSLRGPLLVRRIRP